MLMNQNGLFLPQKINVVCSIQINLLIRQSPMSIMPKHVFSQKLITFDLKNDFRRIDYNEPMLDPYLFVNDEWSYLNHVKKLLIFERSH